MSRLSEWLDREETLLRSEVRSATEKIDKMTRECAGLQADIASCEKDLAYLESVKKLLGELEFQVDLAKTLGGEA